MTITIKLEIIDNGKGDPLIVQNGQEGSWVLIEKNRPTTVYVHGSKQIVLRPDLRKTGRRSQYKNGRRRNE